MVVIVLSRVGPAVDDTMVQKVRGYLTAAGQGKRLTENKSNGNHF